MSPPLGLAVTSSTGVMSVAVGEVGQAKPLAAVTLETERRHAEEITPLIQSLTTEAGVSLADLGLLVIDRGPGRFTGLRVGLATVRTLAFALGVPVVGLTSLEVLVNVGDVTSHERFVDGGETATAVIDARRNEVFQQSFKSGRPIDDAVVGLAEELAPQAMGVVVGDGLDRYPEVYPTLSGGPTARVALSGVSVDASTMLRLAAEVEPRAGSEIEPLYLRNPDVNPNVKTRPRV